MSLDLIDDAAHTQVGSYFVANYPPFSAWRPDHVPAAINVLDAPLRERATPLGLYLHIPFCRKRCKFCYFRVYTEKNARDVDTYIEALSREVALYANRRCLRGRTFDFVYFGGGTPSFLSAAQIKKLVDNIRTHWSWDDAREVTFECEPGTLQKNKLNAIKEIGVSRLSLGIEHFDDAVLEMNGRAHKSPEVYRAYGWAREVGFDQINIDLIAGMVGDDDKKWGATVEEALKLQPDSLTVYQMELPYNTVIARESNSPGGETPVADWATKRAWVRRAFDRFREAGYEVSSAYTVVKPTDRSAFVYRDAVWRGADMVGTGVASFSHVGGVHYQNVDGWDDYVGRLRDASLPISRALPIDDRQRLIREFVLQMKLGRVRTDYFRQKFGVDVLREFAEPLASIEARGWLSIERDSDSDASIQLTDDGLLRVDGWLPAFFEARFQNVRYT